MASRRDWLLQQMGITQYRLHHPRVLQGEVAVRLHPDTRLVIVAADNLPSPQSFLQDVLRSLGLEEHQSRLLTARQLAMLPEPLSCPVWLLGIPADKQYSTVQLVSPPLAELINSSAAKRTLWQQITTYDSHFFSRA
ncbi:DNA polymerase III subunit psi [Tatumella citrea]|uniref:DNA polymerase III subunit psi n=1 Tax=Tatumella citrea TaxID=53336 RepID=A0A1Y0LNI9_TATCI|nr:DNA polymerase III subunit psi [Tatumella citrea]ARU95230.1 DNA polymerase III subunit psi [Tatumella citrea]ARU99270.1 DNA polymerase III subunit psi [Tatumella citrea]